MLIVERDLALDMGTSSTLLFEQGKGVVIREPTVVAVDKYNNRIVKVGVEAQKMLGRTPANIVPIHPVASGVISDYEIAAQFLRELISRVTSFSFFKPCVLACVPSSISGVEERAIIDASLEAGARKVYLIETAVATAMGAGVDISKPDGHMIIDIGGGTTEIAVVSGGGVVECQSIKTAGASFDEAIVKYVRRNHNMLIDTVTAETVKRSIGCVIQKPETGMEEIKGRNLSNGLLKKVDLSSSELMEAFADPMNRILEALHSVLERTPPQLIGDLDQNGIIMSGGGSLIYGIDRLIERSTKIRTMVVDDALSCSSYGAGKLLEHIEEMEDGMMNFYRKRQLRG